MKVVSPLSPPTDEQQDNDVRDDSDTGMDGCNAKRRRLHSQTNVIVATTNGHYRHRKHIYPRHDDKSSSSTDCFDTVNGTCNSSSDCDDDDSSTTLSRYPDQPNPVVEMASPRRHEHKASGRSICVICPHKYTTDTVDNYQRTAIVNNNNCNTEGDCMTSTIRNAVQQLNTNNDNNITLSLSTYTEKNKDSETNRITHEPASSPMEHPIKSPVISEKHSVLVNTADFDDPAAVIANDFVNSETSNDECLSQSPLNLTRSQGSSEECGNKSEEDDEYDDDKNSFVNANIDDETMVNGHNLLGTEAPFPWSISPDIISGKHKHNRSDDKIAAQPPQLLLTSGQLNTGCLQAAQLLIPTPRGIMTQTILAIPINDMVASAMTAPTPNQQQLQQQLLYHASNNIRQKNNIINRQQPKQTCPPPPVVSLSLPLNRYFQHQAAADDNVATTNVTDDVNSDHNNYDACSDMINNSTIVADQYNDIQRRKWHTPSDLPNKKHQFVSPQQQQQKHGAKNGERGGELTNAAQSSAIQTPAAVAAGTNGGDCRIYSTSNNNAAGTPTSPPAHGRNGNSCNGGGTDVAVQRQTVWPTAVTGTDQHNDGNENDNEEDKQQQPSHHQPSHGVVTPVLPTSSTNLNNLKSLAQSSSQLNCHGKPSKDDDSASAAAAAAAAYNQQNAICTALATHMLCASQLAAAQQPMFDNLDNTNAVKKPNHIYNNNNNNSKTNNMMGVVNPAVLEKWMMEERYYYNNNNNNNKNIAGGHAHHQRYNAAAAAAAAAAAVELLSGGGVSASSSGGGADSLASCKKRKRRTSFTPHALELLNGHFERNTHPSGSEITGLAHRLGYEREVIRIWFCNKRQALKNTVRTINGSGPVHMTGTKSHNPGGY